MKFLKAIPNFFNAFFDKVFNNFFKKLYRKLSVSHYENAAYDRNLLLIASTLMCIGLVIVASASIQEGLSLFNDPSHYLKRQALYIGICILLIGATVNIPMSLWLKWSPILLILSFLSLIAVLVIGTEVNGSHRWLRIAAFNIQPAEFAKLSIILFLSGYLLRRQKEVADKIKGFIKPLLVLSGFAILLLLQPDLGSTVVIVVVMMGMLFIADAKLISFIGIGVSLLAVIVILIVTSPYRMARVFGFLDPWADPFGRSYQLTQSLMAFGRGGFFGEGLGNSVLKLKYLPEAHTDFIMAILAEEFGFVGVSIVIILEFVLVYKAFEIGKKALEREQTFPGFVAIGIAIWLFFQTAVNVGAASGIAPTKGLTLPLVSYGGSSLISIAIAIAILLRVDFETRKIGVQARNNKKINRGKNEQK